MSSSVLSTASPQPDNWRKWLNYSVEGLVIVIALSVLSPKMTVNILGLTAFLFLVLGVKRPAFVVAAIILVELTIANYPPRLFGMPMNTGYVVAFGGLATTFLMAPLIMAQRLTLGPGWRRVIIPAAVLVVLIGISTALGFTPELTSQVVRYYVAAFVVMLLIATLVRTRSDLKLVGTIGIAVLVISAVSGIMQHYSSNVIPAAAIYHRGLDNGRVMGLTSSAILSSGHFMIGVVFLWGLVTQLTLEKPAGRFMLLLTMLVFIGLYYTFTRTAVLGVALGGGLFMTPFLGGRVRKEIVLALLLLVPVAAFFLAEGNNRYNKDESNNARIVLWKVGIEIAQDYPLLGIGNNAYNLIAPLYVSEISFSDSTLESKNISIVEVSPVHNDFLRVWLSFGTPALIAYILLFLGIAANALQAYFREKDPWLRGASLGCFGATVAYVINSTAHNSLDSTGSLWILAGLSIVLLRLSYQKQES